MSLKKPTMYELFGTDSEEEKEEKEEKEEDFPELHHKKDDLMNFINDNKYTAVLVYSPDCEPCKEFKPMFYNMKHSHVKFGLLDLESYEDKFGEIEYNDIKIYPTVQLCKRGEVFRSLESPTVKAIEKQLNCMVNCIGQRALSDECKYRGLRSTGSVKVLKKIIEDDDAFVSEIGFIMHEKTKEELIEYLENTLKIKSKTHAKMSEIQLMRKIRKSKKKLSNLYPI